MLEQCKNAKELWGGVHDLIDRWLNERREVIVRMFAITGLPDGKTSDEPVEQRVEAFCEILVDYVSAGHFEIYEQLMREAREFKDGGEELAQSLLPRIQVTTEQVLDFNDIYSGAAATLARLDSLEADVSRVAEALEERFELEDQLIQALHEVHRDKVLTTSTE